MKRNGGLRKNRQRTQVVSLPRVLANGTLLNSTARPFTHPISPITSHAHHRHWSLDLIELHSLIASPYASSSSSSSTPRPLRLILHLTTPPSDKLLMPSSIDACKSQFNNNLKEADFVRWRNTNKVTSLRRADLEAGWEGIVQGKSFSPHSSIQLTRRRLRLVYTYGV